MSWTKEDNIREAGIWLEKKIRLIEAKALLIAKKPPTQVGYRTIDRGGIYLIELGVGIGGEKTKNRPCLVISPNRMNQGHTVLIVPLSTKFKKKPNGDAQYKNHFTLKKKDYPALSDDSALKFEDLRSIDIARIGSKLCDVTSDDMNRIKSSLLFMCGF